MIVVAVYVINLGYGFEGTGARLDELRFISPTLRDSPGPSPPGLIPRPGKRFAGTLWGRLPIPVPANYLLGIDRQKYDFDEAGFWSYLRGRWRQGGWWYYYLYALAIKEPLGTWLLALLALAASFAASGRTGNWRDELLVWAPAVAVLLLVSSQTGFNHHMRYVLPMFPLAAGQQHRGLPDIGANQSHGCHDGTTDAETQLCAPFLVVSMSRIKEFGKKIWRVFWRKGTHEIHPIEVFLPHNSLANDDRRGQEY